MDIVFVGQQAWDTDIGSNAKNIAETFSKQHRVLYVNAPLDRKTSLVQRKATAVKVRLSVIKGKRSGLEQISENLWVYYPDVLIESINWIPFGFLFDWLNYRNNFAFFQSIQKAIAQLGFKDLLLFNDNDMFRSFYLPDLLKPDISIYYSRDNMLAVPYWAKHGTRLEPALMQKSSLCFANSTFLANICRKYNPRSYYVGQGCDLTLFCPQDQVSVPDDLAAVPFPRIGYVGALLGLRLDIALLEDLAIHSPDWHYVLVGPEDDAFRQSALHKLPNVVFLGPKRADELPSYIQSFDVCLNPQKVNEVTIGNYPRKIDEYLAMGKPIVATSTPFMNEVFGDVVFLANDTQTFLQSIAKALKAGAKEEVDSRIQLAHAHSWDNSVQAMYQHINGFLEIVKN